MNEEQRRCDNLLCTVCGRDFDKELVEGLKRSLLYIRSAQANLMLGDTSAFPERTGSIRDAVINLRKSARRLEAAFDVLGIEHGEMMTLTPEAAPAS